MKLYNVYYKGGQICGQPDDHYELTTDNVEKWLEEHNAGRKADGQSIENINEFRVEEVFIKRYKKEKK